MWAAQQALLPGRSYAPTLYAMGDRIEHWATAALERVAGDRLIVVGCSIGGSCAVEVARIAPHRVAAVVLIGTKVEHRPEPGLHAAAVEMLREQGIAAAWQRYWAPLFSPAAERKVLAAAERIAFAQSSEALKNGVTAFHTRPSRMDYLANATCPIVFVTGADDVAPGPATNATQAATAASGSLHVIAHCGHYVPMERPAELNAILRNVMAAAS